MHPDPDHRVASPSPAALPDQTGRGIKIFAVVGAFLFSAAAPMGMSVLLQAIFPRFFDVRPTGFELYIGVPALVIGLAGLWPVGALARRLGPTVWLLPAISTALFALVFLWARAMDGSLLKIATLADLAVWLVPSIIFAGIALGGVIVGPPTRPGAATPGHITDLAQSIGAVVGGFAGFWVFLLVLGSGEFDPLLPIAAAGGGGFVGWRLGGAAGRRWARRS